jgi:hypothetical protein
MESVRKISGYVLLIMVIIVTAVAILGIWDVLDLRNILSKSLASLLIIFAASAVVLFIFAVIINFKDSSEPPELNSNSNA